MVLSSSIRKTLLLAAVSAATAGLPALAPAVPAVATVIRVTPVVREIVRTLRQIDLPAARRRHNWIGDRGEGSCVHASLVHLLHWQGMHGVADWWVRRYANGETPDGLASKLDSVGIPFAETRSGDAAFLEWAVRTRRGAAVVVQNGAHMVNLVGLDHRSAWLLDSNSPDRVATRPRDEFLNEWKRSGGWAVTPVCTPSPPRPWIVKRGRVTVHSPGTGSFSRVEEYTSNAPWRARPAICRENVPVPLPGP